MRFILLGLIRIYQKTVSPDHGLLRFKNPEGFCRFKPTCSEYSYQAISRFGTLKGGWLAVKRILRCNPWSKGGWDPLEP